MGLLWLAASLTCMQVVPARAATPPGPQSDHASPSNVFRASPDVFRLSIVGTNDLHGHIETLPLLAGYLQIVRARRAEDGGAVLLLDGGDMFQGTLESNLGEGAAVVRAYNALGYAAAAVGNHEFDFGPADDDEHGPRLKVDRRGALKARALDAHFPLLTANVIDEQTGRPLGGTNLKPSALVDVAGIKLGIVGITTLSTASAVLAANFRGLQVRPLAASAASEAYRLRKAGAQVVVLVAHAGADCRAFDAPDDLSSCTGDAEIFDVARALPEGLVDAVVAGHTHARVAHAVNRIPIIEAGRYGLGFGRIDLLIDRKRKRVVRHEIFPPQSLCADRGRPPNCEPGRYEGTQVVPDGALASVIAPDLARAARRKQSLLGVDIRAPVLRAHKTESALGNLFADLMRAARPSADVALMNAGGLREDLPAGPLRYGALFEAFPFDNAFAWLRLRADELAAVFALNLQRDNGFLAVSGLRVVATCAQGRLVVALIGAHGPLPPDQELSIVTSDFLATGGDDLLPLGRARLESGPFIREAMADVLRTRGGILAGDDVSLWNPAYPRVQFAGQRPQRPIVCPR